MRVFLAGATGAVGRPVLRQLVDRGHQVTATTRSASKLDDLRRSGATAVVVDGLDCGAVGEAVARAEPDAIIHQMTALAGKPNMRHFGRWFAVTNERMLPIVGHGAGVWSWIHIDDAAAATVAALERGERHLQHRR